MGVVSPLLLPDLALLDPGTDAWIACACYGCNWASTLWFMRLKPTPVLMPTTIQSAVALAVEALGLMGRMLLRARAKA